MSFNAKVLGRITSELPMLFSAALPRIASMSGIPLGDLLAKHTAFRYATAFLPRDDVALFRQRLLGSMPPGLRSAAAIISNATVKAAPPRFCPECVATSLAAFGESYWRRTHLLPAVLVCLEHGLALREAQVRPGASLLLPHNSPSCRVALPVGVDTLMSIAEASVSLLEGAGGWPTSTLYRRLADAAGYRETSREIAGRQIAKDLHRYYGQSFLASLGCDFRPDKKTAWPALLVRNSAPEVVPVKHVLMRVFLEHAPMGLEAITRQKPGRLPRNYTLLDAQVATDMTAAASALKRTGETMTAWGLLERLGAWQSYRHNISAMPLTRAAVEHFRQSPQCSWRIVRKGESAAWEDDSRSPAYSGESRRR